jgi:mono/diheme cytochrome c family protein
VVVAQDLTTPAPPLATLSMSGPYIFEFYCAPCHGPGGRGDGPVGAALKTQPANLTTLAARHGGVFPRRSIEDFITFGRTDIAAHGSAEMPVWGPTFRSHQTSDLYVTLRIAAIVDFIETLQQKP